MSKQRLPILASLHTLSSTPGETSISLLKVFTVWSFVNLSEASPGIAQQAGVSGEADI